MYRGAHRQYKVVRQDRHRYAVWHVDAPVGGAWNETNCQGTVAECWDYIQVAEGQIGWLFRFPAGGA